MVALDDLSELFSSKLPTKLDALLLCGLVAFALVLLGGWAQRRRDERATSAAPKKRKAKAHARKDGDKRPSDAGGPAEPAAPRTQASNGSTAVSGNGADDDDEPPALIDETDEADDFELFTAEPEHTEWMDVKVKPRKRKSAGRLNAEEHDGRPRAEEKEQP